MPPARVAVYLATAGVLVLTFRAILVGPPPLEWSVLVLLAYAMALLAGVLSLRWRVFVDALVRGPRGARGVALTFDAGPHPKWTLRVLETLAKHDAKATFFLVGREAALHPEIVKAIAEAGHAVGLRSWAHDPLLGLRRERTVRDDLQRGLDALERATGARPTLFRPPRGRTTPILARVVDALDLTVVAWSVAGGDRSSRARVDDVVARVRRGLRDGAIVLLHDSPETGDREPSAVRALPAILDAIAAEGLEVVPLPPWLD